MSSEVNIPAADFSFVRYANCWEDAALLIGAEYQYWRNKFGNSDALTGGRGNTARTPMLRLEHHF